MRMQATPQPDYHRHLHTALLIKLEIGSVDRFLVYKRLVSRVDLAPSLHQSGDVAYQGSIIKQGSRALRWIMVEAASVAVNIMRG